MLRLHTMKKGDMDTTQQYLMENPRRSELDVKTDLMR